MILITGGLGSGKRTYAQKLLGIKREEMDDGVLGDSRVLCNLQDLVAKDPENSIVLLDQLCEKEAVLCNEVGCGVVPIDARQRLCREQTGRLCILLAQRAEKVVRMQCGIPMIIKGQDGESR